MDIKLRARLSAYSKVETFDFGTDQPSSGHNCNLRPISIEDIDDLFNDSAVEDTTVVPEANSTYEFIDSLF